MKSKKNKGLGKGLSALFGDQKSPKIKVKIKEIFKKHLLVNYPETSINQDQFLMKKN